MPQHAIDPETGQMVTPEGFVRKHGPSWRDKGILPFCGVCGVNLFPHAVPSVKVVSDFHHPKGSLCPLSSRPDPRYAHLTPSEFDPEEGKKLLETLCEDETLKATYAVCLKICRTLTGNEFVDMCRAAHRFRIWNYKGMTVGLLPYVLVTLADLPKTEKRLQPLRLILHKPSGSSGEVLWLRPEDCSLIRIHADTGSPTKDPPIPVPWSEGEKARKDTGWISESLFRIIKNCGRPQSSNSSSKGTG